MATSRNRAASQAAATNVQPAETIKPAEVVKTVTLEEVIAATKANSFVYTGPNFYRPHIESGMVEINTEIKNEAGEFATRATPKALNVTAENTQPQTPAPAAASVAVEKPVFVIEDNIQIPDRVRGGGGNRAGRAAVYPFEDLKIGQSFFVADKVGEKPAFKTMASTVAGANARYTEEIPGQVRTNRKGKTVPATKQLRFFKIFASERDVVDASGAVSGKVKGARIFRVAVEGSEAAAQ